MTLPWTTPHMRAERALLVAGEHLTLNRIPEARQKIMEVQEHLRWLNEAIDQVERTAAEIRAKQEAAKA